jgi:hypothetical protein
MGEDLHCVQQNLSETCCMCGHTEELFELLGSVGKLCSACSADVATVAVLRTEIDTATFAGQNTNDLVKEFSDLTRRLLTRAQSADALES